MYKPSEKSLEIARKYTDENYRQKKQYSQKELLRRIEEALGKDEARNFKKYYDV